MIDHTRAACELHVTVDTYPFLEAEGNARVFALFAEADDSFSD